MSRAGLFPSMPVKDTRRMPGKFLSMALRVPSASPQVPDPTERILSEVLGFRAFLISGVCRRSSKMQ